MAGSFRLIINLRNGGTIEIPDPDELLLSAIDEFKSHWSNYLIGVSADRPLAKIGNHTIRLEEVTDYSYALWRPIK